MLQKPQLRSPQALQGFATSTIIGSIFALVWGINGTTGIPPQYQTIGRLVVIGVTVVFLAMAFSCYRLARGLQSEDGGIMSSGFRSRTYRLSVLAMVVGIIISAYVLNQTGFSEATISVVAIIVGLHFIPFTRAFNAKIYWAVGGGMAVLGVLSLVVPAHIVLASGSRVALRQGVVGLGCTLILWIGQIRIISVWRNRHALQAGRDKTPV